MNPICLAPGARYQRLDGVKSEGVTHMLASRLEVEKSFKSRTSFKLEKTHLEDGF